MYDDEATASPLNIDHFWEMVEMNLEYARHVLEDYPLQTKEEALEMGPPPAFLVLGYRGTSVEMDQRGHFYHMGRALLPRVARLIEKRALTLEFVQQWGKLMFCHGMLANYIFEDSDPLHARRGASNSARSRNADLQRLWLAKVFSLPKFIAMRRAMSDFEIEQLLASMRGDLRISSRYPTGWFDNFLTKSGTLRSTYQAKNFSSKKIAELASGEHPDLPPPPIVS